ncbi:F0F1 ATP synthase subunit B [Silicimonas sp. MF1-12-2]|uniref:F0F1 ATP synthase subunit B n=1 Tax=Silicimonas sp. MF1-12-2 TaxID=3384793 RepID=UPI0039B4A40B
MRNILALIAMTAATPVLAASKNPFSADFYKLSNTDFIVAIAFFLFIGVLFYFKVPGLLGGLLDKRAEGIKSELDEARALREEAQSLLASYERKQREVQEQANRIVEAAKESATEAAEQAKKDLAASIERRVQAAEGQIASAESAAIKKVRDEAARIAVAAAGEVIAKEMTPAKAGSLVDDAIKVVQAKLH